MPAHEGVVSVGDLRTGGARLEQRQGVGLGGAHRLEGVEKLGRGLAEDDGAGNFGVEAAGAVVLDQQREVIARLQRAALEVAADEGRATAERGRSAEEDALLATLPLACLLSHGGHVDVAQRRPDRLQDAREDGVLHRRGLADQGDLLRALDRLVAVDQVGGVDDPRAGARERGLERRDEAVRHRARADQADRPVAALPQGINDQPRVVVVGVADGQERRRGEDLANAAVDRIAAIEFALHAGRAHRDDRHQVLAVEDHRGRIAVVGGDVGEPFDVAAEPVVVGLHHQCVDVLVRHALPDQRPTSGELGIRDPRHDPFRFRHPRSSRCAPGGIDANA